MDFAQKLSVPIELKKPDFRFIDFMMVMSALYSILYAIDAAIKESNIIYIISGFIVGAIMPFLAMYLLKLILRPLTGKIKINYKDELTFVREMDLKKEFIRNFIVFEILDLLLYMFDHSMFNIGGMIIDIAQNALAALFLAIVGEYLTQKAMKGGK